LTAIAAILINRFDDNPIAAMQQRHLGMPILQKNAVSHFAISIVSALPRVILVPEVTVRKRLDVDRAAGDGLRVARHG
jgi:hypothetical protein